MALCNICIRHIPVVYTEGNAGTVAEESLQVIDILTSVEARFLAALEMTI